jgi:hypothetical protein
MSAHLVENRDAKHDVEDDLESSLYVVLWVVLLCMETYLTIPAVLLLKGLMNNACIMTTQLYGIRLLASP